MHDLIARMEGVFRDVRLVHNLGRAKGEVSRHFQKLVSRLKAVRGEAARQHADQPGPRVEAHHKFSEQLGVQYRTANAQPINVVGWAALDATFNEFAKFVLSTEIFAEDEFKCILDELFHNSIQARTGE